MKKGRISRKIVFAYTALLSALILGTLYFVNGLVRTTHMAIIEREMDEKMRFIEVELSGGLSAKKDLTDIMRGIARIISLRVTVIAPDGTVLADSAKDPGGMENHRYRREVIEALASGKGRSIHFSSTIGTEMLYHAKRSDGHIIRLAKPLNEIDRSLAATRRAIIIFGLAVLAAALAINIAISRWITRPIREIIDFAEVFSRGDYSGRIRDYSGDEMGSLQRSLNRLADIIVDKIRSLELERKKLELTIDGIGDGIAVIDASRKILIANRGLSSLLSIEGDTRGRNYFEVIRGSVLNARIDQALTSGEEMAFEAELPGGLVCEAMITPIAEEKTLQGVLVVLHDVTERRRIDRLKTELVGNLSHELKTPIAIVRGYLDTIESRLSDPAECRSYIESAVTGTERMNSIINDMLKLNMLETSQDFPAENIDPVEIIDDCLDILAEKIRRRSLKAERRGAGKGFAVTGNRFLAQEIFFNLIDNAIHYNREGGSITVTATVHPGGITIAVGDSGIGIPPDSLDRIFERFYRVDKSRSRSTGGTGLGLAIVKHAAELLHWRITVTSVPGDTVFTVEIGGQVRP